MNGTNLTLGTTAGLVLMAALAKRRGSRSAASSTDPLLSIVDADRYGRILRDRDTRTPLARTRYGDALYLEDLPGGWEGKGTHKGIVVMASYFNALGETFPVFRGVPVPKGEPVRIRGTHWSTDRAIAENFARGEHAEASSWPEPGLDDAVLLSGTARLEDVSWPETMRLFLRHSLTPSLSLERNRTKAEREVVLASPPRDIVQVTLDGEAPKKRGSRQNRDRFSSAR
jgi:hypothetical protein